MNAITRFLVSTLISGIFLGLIFSPASAQDEKPEQASGSTTAVAGHADQTITLIVMDPLSSQLACDCVQGYAQRNYEKFGYYLSSRVNRPVHVIFAESLADALVESKGRADIVIGKHSVIRNGGEKAALKLKPVLRLTDQKDSIEQTGLIVVRSKNAAQTVADLQGYRILYGPSDCDEKYSAPQALLEEHGIKVAKTPPDEDICSACSVAAKRLMEMSDQEPIAAVISSYAQPLLEGCGNIQKGDLRIVGESKPVPFVTVFFHDRLPLKDQTDLIEAFSDVELDGEMLAALETGSGFVPWQQKGQNVSGSQHAGSASLSDSTSDEKTSTSDSKKKN